MNILARMSGRNKGESMGNGNGTQPEPDRMTWWQMGAADARDGMHCIPEMYTNRLDAKLEYCLGYESVKPGTLTATYFISRQPVEMGVTA
jgi:hypothetical protein